MIILAAMAIVVVMVGLVLIVSALIACALRKRGQKSSTPAFNEAKGVYYLRHSRMRNKQYSVHVYLWLCLLHVYFPYVACKLLVYSIQPTLVCCY